jgi:hypothetical protein
MPVRRRLTNFHAEVKTIRFHSQDPMVEKAAGLAG